MATTFELTQGNIYIGVDNDGSIPVMANLGAMTTAAIFTGIVIKAPRDGTLHSFEFYMSAAAQVPTNGLRMSFQTVDANGNPDNTDDQFRVVASGSLGAATWITPPGPLTDDGTDTGVKRTVVAGEPLALVMKFESFVAGDSITNGVTAGTSSSTPTRRSTNSGGTWTKTANFLNCVLRYTDGYEHISPDIWPSTSINTVAYNSASTPDERGLAFSVPYDFEFAGIEVLINGASATQVNTAKLYSADNTLLDSVSFFQGEFTAANTLAKAWIPFDRFSPCTANTVHRVTLLPSSTNNVTLYEIEVPTQAHLNAFSGGEDFYTTHRTDAGAFSDTLTRRPIMRVALSRFDAVVGGGRQGTFQWIG